MRPRLFLAATLCLIFLLQSGLAQDTQGNQAASTGRAQSTSFTFRAGQSMYIVAFRRAPLPLTTETEDVSVNRREYFNSDLDAERKVRKRIEDWTSFKVADRPSAADFVFLVNLDENSIEGLAISWDTYSEHFKDKFDMDALRDAAYGRYLVGPLKLSTLSRLCDRLVKQFREKVTGGANH
jgi:hypothetical protein